MISDDSRSGTPLESINAFAPTPAAMKAALRCCNSAAANEWVLLAENVIVFIRAHLSDALRSRCNPKWFKLLVQDSRIIVNWHREDGMQMRERQLYL